MDEEKKEDVAVVVMEEEEKGDPPVECCHPVDDNDDDDDDAMNVEEAQEQALQPATSPNDDDDDADHNQNEQDQSNDEQQLHQEPQQQQQQPAVDEEEHKEKDANDGNEDEDSSSQHDERSSKSSSSSEDDDESNEDDDDDSSSSTDDEDNNNNNNAGLQQRRAKTIHRDDDGHELSEYELLRLERIRRNKEKLAQLGLLNAVEQQPPPTPKKRASKPPADGDAAPSRSSLSRSSKQNVNYAELRGRWSQANNNNNNKTATGEGEDQQSLSQSQHDNDNYLNLKMPPTSFPPTKLPPLSQQQQHHNNTFAAAKPSSSTSVKTKKKPRMAKFIYREFQRIQTLQQQTLRQAKRHCRWAKGHVQHWQKCREKYQRHLERLAQEEERKCYGGKTLRELLREVEVRQGELLQAARMYDQRQQAAIDAAHLELQRQEDAKKMEIVDALERFPKVMKRSMMTLNKLLLDRAPRDPPPPRRSKRKTMDGTTPSNNNNNDNDGMEDVEVEEDIPRLVKKAKLAVASASLPPTMAALAATAIPSTPTVAAALPPTQASLNEPPDEDVAEAAAELPSAKKRHAVAKNVGGWVSPPFAQDVDRRWLERDVPDTTSFRLDHYVPQVGDTVLYYPEGHRLFLKVHPDWLGKKTRAIARLPLWERARKEQQKKPPKQQKQQQQQQAEEERTNGLQDYAAEAVAHGTPPAATTSGAHDAATSPPTATTGANDAAASPPTATVSNDAASIIKAQFWWSEEWLNSIDSKTALYPILCRVEKTQAEFPADTTDKVIKKDHQNGNIQIIWKNRPSDGGKKRERRPPLCLAVTLRALTPISSPPPSDGEPTIQDEKQLALPPKFTVVTFPSAVARPFLVPFAWAYRKFHTLTLNARVAVQSPAGMNGNITGAKVIGFDHPECPFGSLRLDDQYPLLARWLSSWQLNLESTPQSIFDALSQDFQFRNLIAPYPLVDALAVVETWIHVVKSQGADGSTKESGTNQATPDSASELDFRSLIRKTLPLWDGVSVARDAYDRRRHSFSPWDLDLQMPAQPKSPPKGGRFSSSHHHHLTASLDNALRLKVEMTLEDFLKRSEHADIFSPLVSDREAPSYSCAVPLGMAFERILRRLAVKAPSKGSCYYRHADAILSDIALIEDNCLLYNSPDAEIVEKAAHIVMEAKRHVTQVVSNHNRELDSRLKEEEQRQRFVQLQCDAVVENRLLDSESTMAPVSRKNVDSNEMFTPYKDALYRDWLQDFEPDGSWVDSANQTAAKVSSGHGVGTFWLPQAGDSVFYCESAHAEFLRAHYQSLTNEQCELPRLRRTQAAETDQPDELLTNDSSHSHTTNTSWVMGIIQRVKAMFPLRKPKQESRGDGGFPADSPILALEVRFDCGSCDVVTIHWRPCDFSRNPCTSQCCSRCGLSLISSFLHPAWLPVERTSTVLPNPLSGGSLGQPMGLTKDDIESVNRCFNLLKRRCISGIPPDFVDPQQCIFDLKRGVYPVAKVKASSLPAFEDVFRVDKDESSRVGTRGVRGSGPEKHESVLAEAAFLPRWVASNSNEDSDTVDPKRCESLFPCPNFCLELVQLRLRHGYYRHRAAILDEIEEAYIQSVLLLLSSPATRKKNPISIKKLARLLSSKSNMARYFEALSGNSWSEPNVNKSGALGSSSPLKPASQNGVVTGSTLDEETLWMARLEKIRRLYAIAHVCVSETALTELIFGTSPHLKGKPKEPSSSIVVNPVQEAARQKLHWVLGAVGTDFCLNRYSSPLPQVRLKITCGGEVVTGNPYEANDGQTYAIKALSFNIGDVRGHHSLAQLFFGRPAKMGPCARCQVYQRSMVDCRVVRTHSNVDFDWGSFCRDMGGIDGILQQLRTSVTATASAPPRPPEVANAGVVPTPDRPCPENSMDSHAERPTTPPGSQDSSPPLVTQDSSLPTLSQESSTPLLSQCSNTPSLTQDPPTPGHVNADNTPEAAESKCNESKTQITTIEGADKKSGTQNSIIESTNATDMETATQVTVSEATAADKESITNEAKVSGAAADGVDMELETLVDPREDFEKAMLAARLSSELLLEAQAAAQAPSRLHGDFISAYFPVDPEDGHYIYCVSCGLSGDLLCCDGCPNVLHQDCAGLTRIPEGDWFCRTCSARARSSFPTAAEVPKKQAPTVLEGAGDNSPDFEEKWRSKFIGAAPFDFEKEAKLSGILEELRLSRLPPEVRKSEIEKKESDNAEKMPAENTPSSSNQTEAPQDQNSSKGMPEGFIQIGLVINKNFGSLGTFSGKVTSLPTDTRPFYGIRYDDGDQEDMSEGELQDHLPLYTLKKLKAVQKQQQAAPSNARPDESSSQPNAASTDEPKRRPRGRPRKGEVRPSSRVVSLSMPPRKSRRLDAKSTTTASTTASTTTTSNAKPRTLENQVDLQDPPNGSCGSRKHDLVTNDSVPPPPMESRVHQIVNDLDEDKPIAKQPRLS